jgi:hypothetical protein
MGLSPQMPGFNPKPVYVGFVVDKVYLVRFSSEYFGFALSASLHQHSVPIIHSCNNLAIY